MKLVNVGYRYSFFSNRLFRFIRNAGLTCCCSSIALVPQAEAQEEFFADSLTKSVIYYKVKGGDGEFITSDNIYKAFLSVPASAYSEIKDQPAVTNTVEWNMALGKFNRDNRVNLTLGESVKLFASENGLTKARPGLEINMHNRSPGYHADDNDLIIANATKAGIDGDIFYKSIYIFGPRYITIAAKFAVAAQILREKIQQVLPSERNKNGIRQDVLARYLSSAVSSVHTIPEFDKNYLMDLLHHKIKSGDYQSKKFKYGVFTPPAQFRIARLAAAYRDGQGYINHPPCFRDGKNRDLEGSQNLCFTNMTDKALYAWYKDMYAMEMRSHTPTDSGSAMAKLAKLLIPIAMIMDGLAAAEFLGMLETAELGAEEALTEEEVSASEARYFDRFCPA
jgi:hypothetical protein